MALSLTISEDFDTADELLEALEHIAALISDGYTSGYHPGWQLSGEESPLAPEEHHEDCDYRNSMAARETESIFGVPDGETPTDVFDCNLNCTRER